MLCVCVMVMMDDVRSTVVLTTVHDAAGFWCGARGDSEQQRTYVALW